MHIQVYTHTYTYVYIDYDEYDVFESCFCDLAIVNMSSYHYTLCENLAFNDSQYYTVDVLWCVEQ